MTMSFLIALAVLALIGAAGMVFGADSRPRGELPPQPQWPFYRHRS